MAENKYSISEQELTKILTDLELIVVSLDRIGSSSDDLPAVKARAAEFIGDPRVFRRLARMRKVLSEIFDEGASAVAARRLERTLSRVKPWIKK